MFSVSEGKVGLDIHLAALGDWVPDFVRVSNRMAGITREPTPSEISAHRGLLAANALRVENLELFVHHVAEGARVRSEAGAEALSSAEEMTSAEQLKADLATIVLAAQKQAASPQRLHRIYTLLSPFTDGNGRCGRALLMWQIMRAGERARLKRSQFRRREPSGDRAPSARGALM
jgi:hypothetical protein